MKEKLLFRERPPVELIEDIFKQLRLTGLQNSPWFTKDELPLGTLENWLPLLEPYYLPCKAKRFLMRDMNGSKLITILRHLLGTIGGTMNTCERVLGGRKKTMYQISFSESYTPTDFVLSFD